MRMTFTPVFVVVEVRTFCHVEEVVLEGGDLEIFNDSEVEVEVVFSLVGRAPTAPAVIFWYSIPRLVEPPPGDHMEIRLSRKAERRDTLVVATEVPVNNSPIRFWEVIVEVPAEAGTKRKTCRTSMEVFNRGGMFGCRSVRVTPLFCERLER